ncbi:DUF4845 domain-containing protein [Cupriavidus campinensis]
MGQKVLGSRSKIRVNVNKRSRGFSLWSLLVVIVIVIAVVLPAVKAIPSMIEFFSVKRAVNYAKDRSANRKEVVANFDRQAQIDRIEVIKGEDLDVSEDEAGRIRSIDFSYRTEIPVYGPLSLLITYSGTQ